MSVFPPNSSSAHPLHLPRARHWPAIGASLTAMVFLLAWSEAAAKVAHGAASVQIAAPMAMSFGAGSLYVALVLGLAASAIFGAMAGGLAAAVAVLPARRGR